MKIAFKIPPIDDLKVEVNLLIEAGKDDISFLLYSKNPFTIQGLFSYSLHNIDSSQYFEDVKKILQGKVPVLDTNKLDLPKVDNTSE